MTIVQGKKVMIKLTAFRSMTFDCYGTLVDWETPVGRALKSWSEREGLNTTEHQLLELFAQSEWINERARPAQLYSEVLRRNLAGIAERLGRTVKSADQDILLEAVRTSEPFKDTVAALKYLKQYYKLGILSNIDNETVFDHTIPKLDVEWDLVVTAENVGAYKPDRPHFAAAMDILEKAGLRRSEMLHLGQAVLHDCCASKAFGFGGAIWVDRYSGKEGTGAVLFAAAGCEDLKVGSLQELADLHRQEVRASPS